MTPLGPVTRLVTLILLVVEAPFLLLGLYEAAQVQGAINRSTEVLGTVVDNSYSTTNDGGTESGAYYPVVEFTGHGGQTVRFTDGAGSLPPDYEVGAQVPVLYDPESKPPARIRSWKRLWFVPTLFVVIGLLPLAVFLIWQAIALRQYRRPAPPVR